LPLITALGLSARFPRGDSLQDSNDGVPKLDHADQLIFCVFDSTKIKPSQVIRQSQRFLMKRQDVSKIPIFRQCLNFSFAAMHYFLFNSEGTLISVSPSNYL
jgi:hypothetical protein